MGGRAHRVSLGDAWSRRVHPDLESERRGRALDVERLTHLLDGGARNTALRREVESLFQDDPAFSLINNYFMTPNERYEAAIRKRVLLHRMAQRLGWPKDGLQHHYAFRAISGDVTFNVHDIATKAIRSLGSEKQIAKWAPLSETYRIIVTFAQTELGHGTYLQGLETEATYDAATQEFVIHSPTMTATKWWPGDLGRSATHALVMAQLVCSGARQGIHGFMVPIRSLRDHSLLPGIAAGNIGPNMDLENADNGFLRLDHVRVPRENMLNRFAQVLPDGTYIRFGIAQNNYLSMVVARVDILVNGVLPALQKACVIATRYSVIRRQSRLRPSDPETKILDYQTQQQKLFLPLAMSYAFHFQLASLREFFQNSYVNILNKDISLLPEVCGHVQWKDSAATTDVFSRLLFRDTEGVLHALTTGTKAMMSDFCTHGAELCRRACGGHGYSKLSALPSLVTQLMASCTYEGENTVLYLQLARFLVKNYQRAQQVAGPTLQKSLPQSVAYLATPHLTKCPAQRTADFLSPELYTMAWAHMATRLIEDSVRHLQTLRQSGADQHEAWDQTGIILLQAAKAHCYYLTVKSFKEALEKLDNEPAIQPALKRLCDLFALHGILTDSGNFLYDGFLSGPQVDMVRTAYLDLLLLIRKDAILLTDAFDFTDQCLNSALGCYDGNVYERLFHWAQMSPNNKSQNPAYEKYIGPLIQSRGSKL